MASTISGLYDIWLTCVSSDDDELECTEVVEEAARIINVFSAACCLKPFPPDTNGFLYYYNPPKALPCIGEICFGLASDLDSFHNGKDLLSPDKANCGSYTVLRNQLIHDGLILWTVLKMLGMTMLWA